MRPLARLLPAGVSAQTIYAIFKNKKRILVSLMNVSPTTGVEDHTLMSERANARLRHRNVPSAVNSKCSLRLLPAILDQVAAVFEVMTEAAKIEPDFERIIQKLNKQRLEHMTSAVQDIGKWTFPRRYRRDYARDTVRTLTSGVFSPANTRPRLVKEKYAEWLADMLIRAYCHSLCSLRRDLGRAADVHHEIPRRGRRGEQHSLILT